MCSNLATKTTFCVFLKQSINGEGGHPSNYLLLVVVQTYKGAIYTCHSFHYTEIRVSWISALNLPAFCFAIRNVEMKLNINPRVIQSDLKLKIQHCLQTINYYITIRKYMTRIIVVFENSLCKILTGKCAYAKNKITVRISNF